VEKRGKPYRRSGFPTLYHSGGHGVADLSLLKKGLYHLDGFGEGYLLGCGFGLLIVAGAGFCG
jgi:hypothetical protein